MYEMFELYTIFFRKEETYVYILLPLKFEMQNLILFVDQTLCASVLDVLYSFVLI